MTVVWSRASLVDMGRIREFHAKFSSQVASRVISMLRRSVDLPTVFPQAGKPCVKYQTRDVRDLIVGDYQLRSLLSG